MYTCNCHNLAFWVSFNHYLSLHVLFLSLYTLPLFHSPSASVSPYCCSPPSPQSISCCSTILYTLAFNRVKARLVFRSRSRRPSRISGLGLEARWSSDEASCGNSSRQQSFCLCGCCGQEGGGFTFFMFSARRSYSSRTSCWRGVSSGWERRLVDWSILNGLEGEFVMGSVGCSRGGWRLRLDATRWMGGGRRGVAF